MAEEEDRVEMGTEGLAEHTLEQRGKPGTWVAGESRAKGTANAQAQHVGGRSRGEKGNGVV